MSDNENLLSHTHRDHVDVDVFVMISLNSSDISSQDRRNSRIVRNGTGTWIPWPCGGEDIKFIKFKGENQFLDFTGSGKFCMVYELR